ncbi:hypothetical protein AAE478_001371 [Parahypoxylon ruwenzoriense]
MPCSRRKKNLAAKATVPQEKQRRNRNTKLSSRISTALALAGAASAIPAEEPPLLQARASLEKVTGFGDNPPNSKMYIYVQGQLAENPAIIVAIRYDSELFAANIVYYGFLAGCFVSSTGAVNECNSTCANRQSPAMATQSGQVVKDRYVSKLGRLAPGDADTIILPPSYSESNPESTEPNSPLGDSNAYVYGDYLTGIFVDGVDHTVPIWSNDDSALFFF